MVAYCVTCASWWSDHTPSPPPRCTECNLPITWATTPMDAEQIANAAEMIWWRRYKR